jgi:hypothetical protein
MIQVSPDGWQVCVWDAGTADVKVNGEYAGTVSQSEACLNLNPAWDDPPPFDLAPGASVTVWAGDVQIDELIVVDLGISYVDAAADTARGWAAPGATVQVWFFERDGDWPPAEVTAEAGAAGQWLAASSVDLAVDQSRVTARIADDDGDVTQVDRQVAQPRIVANADDEWIGLSAFPARETATVALDGEPIGSFGLDDRGDAWLGDQIDGLRLDVGHTIHVEVGAIAKELVIVQLTASADPATDTIGGTAPPNTEVRVEIWDHTDWASTTSDGTGAWSIDTMDVWGYDLQRGDIGDVSVADADGDATMRNWPTPTPSIAVTFNAEGYGTGGWWMIAGDTLPPATPLTIDVDGTSFACPNETPEGEVPLTGEDGAFWCTDLDPVPGVGDVVTVTVGDMVRAITLRPLEVDVLTAGGAPSGTTTPDTDVSVTLNWDDQQGAWVTSDGTGLWTSPAQTLTAGDQVLATLIDEDGDRQQVSRPVPFPRITVEPQTQTVEAIEFPLPAGDTGDTSYLADLTVAAPGGDVCTRSFEMSSGRGTVEMWSEAFGPRCAIRVGDTVSVTSEGITKSVVVELLQVTSIDTAANTFSGIATPGAWVDVMFEDWDTGSGGDGYLVVDDSGTWTHVEPSTWDSEPFSVLDADRIEASVPDDDGDRTRSVYVGRGGVSVDPDLDHVWAWGWPGGATISVNETAWAVPTVCYANVAYWFHYLEPEDGFYDLASCDGPTTGYPAVFLDLGELGIDVVPGDEVSLGDATTTRTLTVRDIRVIEVDLASSRVSGWSETPVMPNVLTALAMGWWELGPGDFVFDLFGHEYWEQMSPDEAGVFRSMDPADQGETVVRWYATEAPVSFEGFTAPVDMGNANVAKAGQTIPLRFRLTIGGEPVLDLAAASLSAAGAACDLSDSSDQVETYASGVSGLQNLGDGYYQYNWKTPKSFARSCREVTIDLGTYGTWPAEPVTFRFTK